MTKKAEIIATENQIKLLNDVKMRMMNDNLKTQYSEKQVGNRVYSTSEEFNNAMNDYQSSLNTLNDV
jgi:glycine/serine hydroxymethyltransferase